MNTENRDDALIAKWGANDALLQSYRSIFMTSQSILVSAVAVTVAMPTEKYITLIISIIAFIQLILGFTVIRARAMIVDFYKFKLSKEFNNNGCRKENNDKALDEHTYVHNRKVRHQVNQSVEGLKKNWRKTRVKVDLVIPISFALLWSYFLLRTMCLLLAC